MTGRLVCHVRGMPPTGTGRVQRHVLDRALSLGEDEYATAAELASDLYGPEPSEAQLRAVRRAIGGLADKGMVTMEYVVRGGLVVLAIRGR